MKIVFLVLFNTLFIGVYGQVSYDFAIPVPPRAREIKVVNSNFFGVYTKENSPFTYEFNETGIYVVTINVQAISKETVRESTKYTVRDGYIFGVIENDSLPCVLEDDKYYFGIRNKEKIAGYGSKNVLYELKSNQLVLNFEENGKYVPTFITFNAEGMVIQQFDYETNTTVFDQIDEKTVVSGDLEIITLDPTPSEWKLINLEEIMAGPEVYLRKV